MRTETNEVTVMSNYKVHVKIGRKYREAFMSICDLVNAGCIDKSVVESCKPGQWIETSQYIFEYTGDLAAIDTGKQVGMMPEGASWFSGFRGGDNNSIMGTWHNLIETVATNYHKEFSLVEYLYDSKQRKAETLEQNKALIQNVVKALKLPCSKITNATAKDSLEDLYAVSLRMELFGGAGEPRPVLCKLYFRNQGGTVLPLLSEEALLKDEYISDIVEKQQSSNQETENNSTEIVDHVLNAVSNLISGNMACSFADSVLILNKTDIDAVNELVNLEPQDEVYLQCKKLKVLGISHIVWSDAAFNIYIAGKKAFLAKIGLNSTVNLYCCCNGKDRKLIENNIILCTSDDGRITRIRIHPNQEGLGLDQEALEMIHSESAFAHHFFPITCSELGKRNMECLRYRCDSNTLAFQVGDKVRRKCADCPYPEVIYRYGDGRVAYTPLLSYDSQTRTVVEEETSNCRFCRRSYVPAEVSANNLCNFCEESLEKANSQKADKDMQRTYKRYAAMLPISVRMSAGKRAKYCFENEDRLLFVVGHQKFFFDKLKLSDDGRIKKPQKRQ